MPFLFSLFLDLGSTIGSFNIITGLERYLPLSIGTTDYKRCIRQFNDVGLQQHVVDMLERLFVKLPEENQEVLFLIAKDPGRYQGEISRGLNGLDPFYLIGRSMYETDTIHDVS